MDLGSFSISVLISKMDEFLVPSNGRSDAFLHFDSEYALDSLTGKACSHCFRGEVALEVGKGLIEAEREDGDED